MNRARLAIGIASVALLTACSSESETPTSDEARAACLEGRKAIMAADADTSYADNEVWEDFDFLQLKNGSYKATWNIDVGPGLTSFYECSFRWEDSEAIDIDVDAHS